MTKLDWTVVIGLLCVGAICYYLYEGVQSAENGVEGFIGGITGGISDAVDSLSDDLNSIPQVASSAYEDFLEAFDLDQTTTQNANGFGVTGSW